MSLSPYIDRNIIYRATDLPKESMMLTTFKQPLTLQERYSLAKRMYPWSFFDEDTNTTWILYKAKDLGFSAIREKDMILVEYRREECIYHWEFARSAICEKDMILAEYTEDGCIYHWEFARNWDTDQLWIRGSR